MHVMYFANTEYITVKESKRENIIKEEIENQNKTQNTVFRSLNNK